MRIIKKRVIDELITYLNFSKETEWFLKLFLAEYTIEKLKYRLKLLKENERLSKELGF